MGSVRMAKVIMELGELGEFWEEFNHDKFMLEFKTKDNERLNKELEELKTGTGEWIVLHPSGDRSVFTSYAEAKKQAVELAERAGLTYKIAQVKETVMKGEEF